METSSFIYLLFELAKNNKKRISMTKTKLKYKFNILSINVIKSNLNLLTVCLLDFGVKCNTPQD